MKQAHIYFSGMVQGVGFRYTVQSYAKNLSIKGWVRNLDDGRVELVAQGSRRNIEELRQAIKNHFGAYIREIIEEWEDCGREFSDFQIQH